MRFRFLALAATAALVVAGVAAGATMAAPDLAGTIGPGFTISLKNAGKNVAALKHGKYVFMSATSPTSTTSRSMDRGSRTRPSPRPVSSA